MRPVLAITHLPKHAKIGLAGSTLRARGLEVLPLEMFAAQPRPELAGVSAVMSFGGQMSVTQLERHPFLQWELELMRAALAEQVPVLGMCLGAQLLAKAGGGDVTRMDRTYVGWPQLKLRPNAARDPLFSVVPDGLPVLKWHQDAIVPPTQDSVVAETDSPGGAVFRVGEAAWGSQMHLETTPDILFDEWIVDPLEIEGLADAGSEPEAFIAEARERLPIQIAGSRPLFDRFGELVAAREEALGRRSAEVVGP